MGRVKELYMDIEESLQKELGREPSEQEIQESYEQYVEGLEQYNAELEERSPWFTGIAEALKPVDLSQHKTNCMGIAFQITKQFDVQDLYYSADGLSLELTFEGKKYSIFIKPKAA